MAKRYGRGGTWNGKLTGREKGLGSILLLLYLTVLPFAGAWLWTFVDARFNIWYSDVAERVLYYAVLAVILFFLFWTLLKNAVTALLDNPGGNLIAFLAGLSGAILGNWLIARISLPVANVTAQTYLEQYEFQSGATVAVVIVLIPIVEELFFRGLVFGWLRNRHRAVAYIISCLLFCLAGVWQYAYSYGDIRYLLLAIRLLPASVAFCWSYDHGGSVWCPMALHMALNAIDLFGTVSI
ncbi:MAG: family intrarane metalloprotease [Oscillospiraceae bacterium]|nr:family intrarane metalloprotease [Oscillospiraceae bacterium]